MTCQCPEVELPDLPATGALQGSVAVVGEPTAVVTVLENSNPQGQISVDPSSSPTAIFSWNDDTPSGAFGPCDSPVGTIVVLS